MLGVPDKYISGIRCSTEIANKKAPLNDKMSFKFLLLILINNTLNPLKITDKNKNRYIIGCIYFS